MKNRTSSTGFTIIELLAVVGVILLLLALLIPALSAARERSRGAVCMSNMKQLGVGMMLYTSDNNGFFPWAGGADQNLPPDWVWGGQARTDTENQAYWSNPPSTFGHHAEAGSIFPYVMHQPPLRNGSGKNGIDETHKTVYPIYRCPSTGELGEALRVNYSMNDQIDRSSGGGPTADGVAISHVKRLSEKILLINEDPRTMHNASFSPGASSDGDANDGVAYDGTQLCVMHYGGVNITYMDGHVSRHTAAEVLAMQKGSNVDKYFNPLK